ncbi:MAG: 30S ribosomal protein S14 [Candidatus Woesearchaeota archaeon]
MLKHNAKKQRKCGKTTSKCIICGNSHGLIRQYDLHICRKCFREVAEELGFINYS